MTREQAVKMKFNEKLAWFARYSYSIGFTIVCICIIPLSIFQCIDLGLSWWDWLPENSWQYWKSTLYFEHGLLRFGVTIVWLLALAIMLIGFIVSLFEGKPEPKPWEVEFKKGKRNKKIKQKD